MGAVQGGNRGFERTGEMTPKREKFAQCVAAGMNQLDAYREAFAVRVGSKPSSINVNASKLMSDTKVRQRVAELTAKAAENVGITLESHLADLEMLRNEARAAMQFGAAITAEVARGKHAGVAAPEKREHTGKGGNAIAVTNVSPAEYRRIALEVAAKT